MARIDSILGIALQQGCDELRVASDVEPKMFANGASKRLHLPAMSTEVLRDLLGEILTDEDAPELAARGRIEVRYQTESGVAFDVSLSRRGETGIEARFLRGAARAAAPSVSRARVPVTAAVPIEAPAAPPPSTRAAPSDWNVARGAVELFAHAHEMGASDLHLREGESPSIRFDGAIRRLGTEPIADLGEFLALDAASVQSLRNGGSLDRSFGFGHSGRARIHVYRSAEGIAAAVRFLPNSAPSLSTLGAPVPLDDLIHISHGLVLVCGATGSGKSTTIASLAAEALRQRSIVMVTLEHPIEYVLAPGESSIVRQREIGRDAPDFTAGLRDAMREDPDVIVVGEMRDPETIALALTAAETGHLVLATLHSGSCASAVDRIVDAHAASRQAQIRTQLADVLRVVVSQRLVSRARTRGRVLAMEVLRMNHAAGALIREGKTHQIASLIQAGRKDGMMPLERSLAERVAAGEVTLEDARAAANDVEAFQRYLTPPSRSTS